FPFLIGKRKFMYGQKVMAMSDRGMTLGYINSVPYEVPFDKSMLPLKSISKVATDEDVHEQRSYYLKEKEAENFCKNLIETHKLDMNLTHVEFIQFGKKAVFYFNAPARVDFRNLVKDLVADLKMRIELRQISVRDRAAAIGAIGVCGLQTCCSSFLKNYGNVSIKMAKNQNLALIPSKINGICGQIKCCIKYEDDVYSQKRTLLPKEGIFLKAKNGDIGRVQKLHLLVEQFDMITEKGQIRRYSVNQFVKDDCKPPKDWKFPNDLRHIVNETSTVIGLTDEEQRKSEEFLKKYSEENGDSVVEVFVDDSDDDNSLEELNSLEGEIQVKTEKKNKRPQNKRPNNRNRNNPKQNNEKKASSTDENTSKPPQKKKYRPKKKKPFKKPE
uniref:PSP1 domain-containing protein n=1 Tax=Halobacteriovorax sp. TaxID=2020862 RepID=UPI00356257EB